ncbi:TonB-dependent receptor [Bosea vestrisii]|uniref:TonB-dependent receptor n=1 Tax=Bosea vestrisii TaxID=151416 RepID=A0ABW0HAF7_9HYPH
MTTAKRGGWGLRTAVAGGVVAAMAAPSAAQQAAPPVIALDEITVTARKIEEGIQRVPLSVTGVSASELANGGIKSSEDLARWVPGFNFTNSGLPFANLLNIRGVGSSSAVLAPAVNYYVDGIPVPSRVFDQRFLDASQIEVLRGPQGTLFGLNAQAGAVTIATGQPTRNFQGQTGSEIGSYGRREANFTLSGPVSETVSARVAGRLYGYDGDIRNVIFSAPGTVASAGRDVREEGLGAISGKVLIQPNAATSVELSAHYRRDLQRPTTGVWLDDPAGPRNAYNPVPKDSVEAGGAGMTIKHDLGWGKLTAITGFHRYQLGLRADIVDGFIANAQTGVPPFAVQAPGVNVRRIDERNTQFTQEVRLDGETAGGVRWVAGVSALHSQFSSTTDITALALANGAYTGKVETTNLAAFGEVTVPLTERLRWIGGLRLTSERKQFDGLFLGRPGAVPAAPVFVEAGSTDDVFLTGRTGLSYDLTPSLTTYVTIARGEKPGGYPYYNQFAAMRVPLAAYRSAQTWSYEAGLRGTPFGDRLQLSAAIFYNDTKDEQLFTFNPVAGRFDVQNANTRSHGAELEAKVKLTDNLMVAANLAVLDSEITSAPNRSLVGNEVPYAPAFTASVAAEYRQPLTLAGIGGSVFGRVEYQHVGCRQIDPANSRKLASYDLVNLRAGWQSERFDVYGYVQNLFDHDYALSAFQASTTSTGRPVFAGVPGTPRTLGLGASFKF